MRVQRDQSNPIERQPEAEDSGSRHRIVSARKQSESVGIHTRRDLVTNERSRLLDAQAIERNIVVVENDRLQLTGRLDIVAPDPPQSLSQESGS
jgi:hypothetical protein